MRAKNVALLRAIKRRKDAIAGKRPFTSEAAQPLAQGRAIPIAADPKKGYKARFWANKAKTPQ